MPISQILISIAASLGVCSPLGPEVSAAPDNPPKEEPAIIPAPPPLNIAEPFVVKPTDEMATGEQTPSPEPLAPQVRSGEDTNPPNNPGQN